MGDFRTNDAEVRGRACEFPAAGHKKKVKAAGVWVLAAGDGKIVLQGMGTQPLRTYVDRRQATVVE